MSKVFPLKWVKQVDRSAWGDGPWDAEDIDREQWADPMTGYACLAIRSDLGTWAGYVAVGHEHPAFGLELDNLPAHYGINWTGYNDDVHFITPPPENENACVDENDPKSVLEVIRMPDHLWFFGFDTAHAGDLIPSVDYVLKRMTRNPCGERQLGVYRDIGFVKKCCAEIASALKEAERTGSVAALRLENSNC
jgi:hypothetical protein